MPIVKSNGLDVVTWLLSLTETVNVVVPVAVGVPVRAPLLPNVNPFGRVLEVKNMYGGVPPEAMMVWLYATPTVPSGSGEFVVKTRAGATGIVKVLVPELSGVKLASGRVD